ncbi:MAG: DUF2027 domain-containing protein [Dysgonamonadaceae bacterium]|jgi:hypothetical protein|nr:DUF2027 domain-containing protein [Dysgonamonadaceae bacterium]
MVKIGDKVRFLNSVGGGIVRRFQTKEIVLVEEEDGFETPVLVRECVVVDTDDFQARKTSKTVAEKVEIRGPETPEPQENYQPEEFSGGDRLNVYLAFLPVDIKALGKCDYETYLVNKSNYYLFFNYMNRENNAWRSRYTELIEPNTRLFIEEFTKLQLNELERICIQFIAFKKEKPYSLKNSYSIELRIDGVKFYKLHSFRENDFFEDEALIYPLVTNDAAEQELLISASDLQESMIQKSKIDNYRKPVVPAGKKPADSIIEVDLHINELLDSTAGLSHSDILEVQLKKFRDTIEENKSVKGRKIVFIHGKGEGVLRKAILEDLKTKYKNYSFQDASFREYGFGATMITIK